MKNVVLMILDALRYDHVTRENMPNLMKIADEGVFFTHAFSCNSSTKLSIPCILSSEKKFDSDRNIAQILRKNLYKTAIIHSNPLIKTFYPGFDITIDIKSSPRLGKGWKKVVRKTLPSSVISGLKKMRTKIYSEEKYLPYSRASETIEFALDWIKHNEKHFLWIHLMDPHIPYYPKSNSIGMSPQEMMKLNDKIVEAAHRNLVPTDKEIEAAKMLYKDEIKEMDAELKLLHDNLSKEDLLIITSDHGEEFNEYGQFSHQGNKIIPLLLHVPLIFYGLNVVKNKVIEDYVSLFDIAPTILDAIDIKEKLGLGCSLWNLITDRSDNEEELVEKWK